MAKLKTKKTYTTSISDKLRAGDDYFYIHKKGDVQVGYKKSKDPEIKLLNFKKFIHRSIAIRKSRIVTLPVLNESDEKKARVTKTKTFLRHIPINPEFCDYIFHVPPASVKFLMYAMGFLVDYETNCFKYNDMLYHKYNKYCQQMNPIAPAATDISKRTLYNAIRDLVHYHIIINLTRGTYMINPLVACMGDSSRLSAMMKQYAQLILDQRGDVESMLQPVQSL